MKAIWMATAIAITTSSWAAAPPVGPLSTARSGDDLVISWEPPATMVDGYKVYRADDVGCTTNTLIYMGTATSHTVIGALGDPTPALYRVTALLGTEESEPSPPAYKYGVVLEQSTVPLSSGLNLLSLPYNPPYVNGQELCTELNGALNAWEPVWYLTRYDPIQVTSGTKPCGNPMPWYDLEPGEAYFATVAAASTEVVMRGHTPASWRLSLPGVYDNPWQSVWGRNFYAVSLPYDHDYPDLAAVAADIPSAVQIRVQDVNHVCVDLPCTLLGQGLERPTSSDPWLGTNVSLEDRRGQGLMIGVDIPTTWEPRRQCTGPVNFRSEVASLRAMLRGDDVELTWDPGQTPGAQGYDVYRVDDPHALSDLGSEPVLLSVGVAPSFPIVDVGAGLLPGAHYYAVTTR